jgi:hypothetical protein
MGNRKATPKSFTNRIIIKDALDLNTLHTHQATNFKKLGRFIIKDILQNLQKWSSFLEFDEVSIYITLQSIFKVIMLYHVLI